MSVEDSILKTTKNFLGLPADYAPFDMQVILHINSVFAVLQQLGVGPDDGFWIDDDSKTWTEYLENDAALNAAKSYMYLKVRMLFDPPATSFGIDAITRQIDQFEWRLNVVVENEKRGLSGASQIYVWDLSNGADFPSSAKIGDVGIDLVSGEVWRKS